MNRLRQIIPALALLLVLHAVAADADNITKILDKFSQYNTFNDYLTKTQLAAEINSRSTITVLVVSDGAMGALTSSDSSLAVIKNVLSLHVLLDYYDESNIATRVNGSTLSTTLFQTTGEASGHVGSMNITDVKGKFYFGDPGTPINQMATLTKEVKADPYNISVLEISKLIVPSSVLVAPPPKSVLPPPPKPSHAPKAAPPKPSHAPREAPRKASPPSPSKAKKSAAAPSTSAPPSVEKPTPAPLDSGSAPSEAMDASAAAATAINAVAWPVFAVAALSLML